MNYSELSAIGSAIGARIDKPSMSYEECINRPHPHNQRFRMSTGFYCEDCGNFYNKDSEEYALHEGHRNPLTIWARAHNAAAHEFQEHGNTAIYRALRASVDAIPDMRWNGKEWEIEENAQKKACSALWDEGRKKAKQ